MLTRSAFVDVQLAEATSESILAVTLVPVGGIAAGSLVPTSIVRARLEDPMFAQRSVVRQWAYAAEGVHAVHADAAVVARVAGALVDVRLAVDTRVAGIALASVTGVVLRMTGAMVAEAVIATESTLCTVYSSESERALAHVAPGKEQSLGQIRKLPMLTCSPCSACMPRRLRMHSRHTDRTVRLRKAFPRRREGIRTECCCGRYRRSGKPGDSQTQLRGSVLHSWFQYILKRTP